MMVASFTADLGCDQFASCKSTGTSYCHSPLSIFYQNTDFCKHNESHDSISFPHMVMFGVGPQYCGSL